MTKGFSRKQRIGIWLMGIGSLLVLPILLLFTEPGSYIYCRMRENVWLAARDQNELESRIVAPHQQTSIAPHQSGWGRGYVLKPGQRMIQYMIFGKAPLDVVYNSDNSIDTIFTSYE